LNLISHLSREGTPPIHAFALQSQRAMTAYHEGKAGSSGHKVREEFTRAFPALE